MHSRTYLSLSFLLLASSLAGGYTESGNSFSTGSTSVSGGGKAYASTGGVTSASVRTSTSVSSSGRPKTTKTTTTGSGDTASTKTTKKGGRGKGKKKATTMETVELGDGTSVSFSSVSGTGTVRASASSSSTPTHSTGTASTTAGGITRTVTKESGSKGTKKGKRSASYEHYPICRGMAHFRCCSDRVFETIGRNVYCGCFGDEPKAEFCSFMRLNSEPLVVQDVFGATSGDICVCKENPKAATTNGIVNGCRGTIKRDCCDQYNGDKNCRCVGDTCAFARVSDKPLMWKSRRSNRVCVCH